MLVMGSKPGVLNLPFRELLAKFMREPQTKTQGERGKKWEKSVQRRLEASPSSGGKVADYVVHMTNFCRRGV